MCTYTLLTWTCIAIYNDNFYRPPTKCFGGEKHNVNIIGTSRGILADDRPRKLFVPEPQLISRCALGGGRGTVKNISRAAVRLTVRVYHLQ